MPFIRPKCFNCCNTCRVLISNPQFNIWNIFKYTVQYIIYTVQYMKHFIYHFTSILHGLIRTHKWPAPNVSGFIAQLVRASHRYREVTGSNPVEVCDDHGLLDFKSAIQFMKHFIYHFTYRVCSADTGNSVKPLLVVYNFFVRLLAK